MTHLDQFVYRYNAWIVVGAAVGYNLAIEHLTNRGYSEPSQLVCRGIWGACWWGRWRGGSA